jgi:hypothetical protein
MPRELGLALNLIFTLFILYIVRIAWRIRNKKKEE